MEKAFHVKSGRIISAKEADYKDYYGLFNCLNCKKIVHLRKGYIRGDEIEVSAAFVHPEADENDLCSLRVDILNTKFNSGDSEISSRGQLFELLQTYFAVILNAKETSYPVYIALLQKELESENSHYIEVSDIRNKGVKYHLYSPNKLKSSRKRYIGKIYTATLKVLTRELNFWKKKQIEKFLHVATQIMKLDSQRLYPIYKSQFDLEFFLENQSKWKAFNNISELTNQPIEEIIKSHYSRVTWIRDFITFSADDLTRRVTVCISLKRDRDFIADSSLHSWLLDNCTERFLNFSEIQLNNPDALNEFFIQIQEGKINSKFQKLAFFIRLILKSVDKLIAYMNWEVILESVIDNIMDD